MEDSDISGFSSRPGGCTATTTSESGANDDIIVNGNVIISTNNTTSIVNRTTQSISSKEEVCGQSGNQLPSQQQQFSSSSSPATGSEKGGGSGSGNHHSPRKTTTAAAINIVSGGDNGRRDSKSQQKQEEKEGTFSEAGTEERQGPIIETLETTTTKADPGAGAPPPGVVVRRVSRKTRRRAISESDNNNGTNSQSSEDVVTADATSTTLYDMMNDNSPSSSKNAVVPRRGSRRPRRTRLDSGGGGGGGGETESPTSTILLAGKKKSPRRGSTGILKNTFEVETNIQPTAGKSSVAPPPPPPPPPPLTTTGQSTAATETTPYPAAAVTLSETPTMTNIKAARRKSTGILKDTSIEATTMPSDDLQRVPTRRGSIQEGGLKQLSGGGGTKTNSQSTVLSRDNNSSSHKKRFRKVRAPTLDELLDHELQDDMIELLGHGPMRFGPAIIPPEITPMQVRHSLAEGSGNQLGDYVKLRLRLESKRKKSGNKNDDADNTKKKKSSSSSSSSSLPPSSPYSSPPSYSLESISNFTDAQLLRFVQFCHSRDPNYYWMISNSRGSSSLSSGDRAYKLLKNCKPYYYHLTAFDAQHLIQDDLILVPIPKLQLLKELLTNPNSMSAPAPPTPSPTLLRSPSDYNSEAFQEQYLNSRILYFRPSRFFPKKSHKADIVDTLVYILDHWTQTDTVLLGKHNFTHPQPVIYAMLVDLQDFDPSYNYTKDYWIKFMAVLQGKIFPVQISVVLWVDPPSTFQHKIWSTTKQMMATSEFASRNYLLTRQELGLYLQTNYQEFLPVDVYYDICYQAGINVDNPSQSLQHMANDYVTFEKYLETIQGKTSIMNLLMLKNKKEEAQKRGRGRRRRFSMPKKLPKSLKKLPGTRGRSKSRSRKQQKSNNRSKSPDRNGEEENLETSYRQEDSNSNDYGEEDLAVILPGEESEPEGGSDVEPSKGGSRSLSVGRLRKRINKRREKRKEKKEQKKAEKERKKNGKDDIIPVQSDYHEGDEEDSVSSSQPSVNASSTQQQDSSSGQRRSSQPNISPALSPEHRRRVGGGVFGGRPVLHKNRRRSSMSVLEELQHEGSTGMFLAATTTTPTGEIRLKGDHDGGGFVNIGAKEGNIDSVDEKGYNDRNDNVAPSLQKEKSIYVDEFLLRDDKQQPEHIITSPDTPKRNRRRRLSLKTLMSPLKSPLKPLKKLGHLGVKYSPRSDSQQGGGDGSSSVVSRSNSMMSESHHSFHGQEVFEQSFAVSQLVSPSSQMSSPNNKNSAPSIVRTPPTPSQRRRYSSSSYQNRTPNNNSSSGDKLNLGASSDGSGMNFDASSRYIDSDESQRSGNNYFDDSLQQSPNYFEDSLRSPNDSNYNASNRKPREGNKESYDWDAILKDAKANNVGGSSYRRLSPQVVKKQTIQQQLELQQLQKSVPIMRPTRRHSAGAFDMIQPPPLSGMSESHNATTTTAAAAAAAATDPYVNLTPGSPSNVKKKQQDLEYFREQVERQKEKTRRLQQQRYSSASSTSTERATKTGGN